MIQQDQNHPFTQVKVPIRFIQNEFLSQFFPTALLWQGSTEMQASQVESQIFLTLGLER